MTIRFILILLIFSGILFSCRKLIEVNPPKTELTPDKVFSTDQTAIAAVLDIYTVFQDISSKLTLGLGMYSDELQTTSPNTSEIEFFNGELTSSNSKVESLWKGFYKAIYQCNDVIEKLPGSFNITPQTRVQLEGEVKFLRAFCYHYLVQLFGDVPLILTTDVQITATIRRTNLKEVMNQIINDLESSKSLLSATYPTNDKVRANKWAPIMLLARVHLILEQWEQAENLSNQVLLSGEYSLEPDPDDVFEMNSSETILQFWTENGFTPEGSIILPGPGLLPNYPVLNTIMPDFLMNDLRRTKWIDSIADGSETYYFPTKYDNPGTGTKTEYIVALRLGELYLISAEAKAHQNRISDALSDLNSIRQRAGLHLISSSISQDSCLTLISKERFTELFCEWGHRFLDLKRNNKLNVVLPLYKPGWRLTASLLPIPLYEIQTNPNLTQNPGY